MSAELPSLPSGPSSRWAPKQYFDNGRTLRWGLDLSSETMASMRIGEIFTLLDADGDPFSRVLMDSYDQIREESVAHYQDPRALHLDLPESPVIPRQPPGAAPGAARS